ncbi:MAG TPA: VCBS repeat-containing protein [Polyangia bacterium]
MATLVACGAGLLSVQCGFSGPAPPSTGGGQGGNSGSSNGGSSGSNSGGSSGSSTGGSSGGSNSGGTSGGSNSGGSTGGSGTGGTSGGNSGGSTGGGTGGMTGMPGTGGMMPSATGGSSGMNGLTFMNYNLTGAWPGLKAAIETKPGKLTYTKITVHTRFLAESCSIADYNKDGEPDISSGRRWWAGPDFKTENVYRGGHDDLPRAGQSAELVTGVSDSWACFPWDVDGDSWTDIINIVAADEVSSLSPMPRAQQKGTMFWYKNPGNGATGMWTGNQMHADVKHEQKLLFDADGDGKPEIAGGCKGCNPPETLGYFKAGANPTGAWTYVPVIPRTYPFGGTGWLHGLGVGDVNKDGKPDLLQRSGINIQQPDGTWNNRACPGAGCGFVPVAMWDRDPADQRGGSHMFVTDIDGDNDMDIVSADGAHHYGVSWYEQTEPLKFTKHQIISNNPALGPVFSQPHSLQVVDMDGDGVSDIVTGKMRFAHPDGYGDPDLMGAPVLYVFKTVRNKPSMAGPVTFEAKMVDNQVGVGRQFTVGHTNKDGIPDICIGSKLGLFVFQGQP